MEPQRIAVVGGSLGGLTAGCLLLDAGHDVTIYERSSRELEQRGAGIGFLAATYRYLTERCGLDAGDISVETPWIRYLNRDGTTAHAQEHSYLFSSWNAVYRELLARFDSDRYVLGHELVGFAPQDDAVTLDFANGVTKEADLLVAADGIGSIVRSALQPESAPRYAGYVAWRGMVPETELGSETVAALTDAITYHVFANSHILVYPIPGHDGSAAVGDRLINFVWYRNYLSGGDLDDLLTDTDGQRRDLSVPPGMMAQHHVDEMRATARARLPAVLAELIDATSEPFVQVIYDIEVERMLFDRTVLLGDAAFAVRPHAAAGTAKAADDAWTLAEALSKQGDLATVLGKWEHEQLRLGADLLERTRTVGSRSQVTNTWTPGDPSLIFGLHQPGD